MKKSLSALMLPACLIMLCACSVKKNMDEMHDKTVEMAKTTSSMSEKTDDLRSLSAWMFNIMKQGDSSRLRDAAKADLVASDSLAKKTLYATKYFYGFEYQIWNPAKIQGVDASEVRRELVAEAIIEFAKDLSELVPQSSNWPLSGTKGSNEMQNLYALAATLHKINPYQKDLLNGTGNRALSMLDILQDGLKKAGPLNRGEIKREDLTRAEAEILREEQLFTYMIRLRVKALPVIALGRISKIRDGLFTKLGMLLFKWTPIFASESELADERSDASRARTDNLNLEQIEYASDILREAIKSREYLAKIGAPTDVDKKVKKIFGKMELKKIKQKLAAKNDTSLLSAIEKFEGLVNQITDKPVVADEQDSDDLNEDEIIEEDEE